MSWRSKQGGVGGGGLSTFRVCLFARVSDASGGERVGHVDMSSRSRDHTFLSLSLD